MGNYFKGSAAGGSASGGEVSHIYDLYGVVNHMGGMLGGHYTSYARTPHPSDDTRDELGKWIRHLFLEPLNILNISTDMGMFALTNVTPQFKNYTQFTEFRFLFSTNIELNIQTVSKHDGQNVSNDQSACASMLIDRLINRWAWRSSWTDRSAPPGTGVRHRCAVGRWTLKNPLWFVRQVGGCLTTTEYSALTSRRRSRGQHTFFSTDVVISCRTNAVSRLRLRYRTTLHRLPARTTPHRRRIGNETSIVKERSRRWFTRWRTSTT